MTASFWAVQTGPRMDHHFHTDAVHILITTAGVVVTIHGGRIAAAWMVKRGGRLGIAGKVLGSVLSFPASQTTAAA